MLGCNHLVPIVLRLLFRAKCSFTILRGTAILTGMGQAIFGLVKNLCDKRYPSGQSRFNLRWNIYMINITIYIV